MRRNGDGSLCGFEVSRTKEMCVLDFAWNKLEAVRSGDEWSRMLYGLQPSKK